MSDALSQSPKTNEGNTRASWHRGLPSSLFILPRGSPREIYGLYSFITGISRFMLCSSEISVSVETTPLMC